MGPVGVSGAFDVPFGHFAFDQARARAESTFRVQSSTDQHECIGPDALTSQRGKNRAPVRASGE